MADFCQECSYRVWGEDTRDLAGLCGPGLMALAICEGCGCRIWVDSDGKRVMCMKLKDEMRLEEEKRLREEAEKKEKGDGKED